MRREMIFSHDFLLAFALLTGEGCLIFITFFAPGMMDFKWVERENLQSKMRQC